jgi:hypothetical protein
MAKGLAATIGGLVVFGLVVAGIWFAYRTHGYLWDRPKWKNGDYIITTTYLDSCIGVTEPTSKRATCVSSRAVDGAVIAVSCVSSGRSLNLFAYPDFTSADPASTWEAGTSGGVAFLADDHVSEEVPAGPHRVCKTDTKLGRVGH